MRSSDHTTVTDVRERRRSTRPRLARAAALAAAVLAAGALGLTGATTALSSTHMQPAPDPTCPTLCLDVYMPVTCELSDGSVMVFSNRCHADVYACEHGLEVISCKEGELL